MKSYRLYIAWLFALAGVIISLYFSEVRHIAPCDLCWYQRIALYPLVIILGIAAYRGDKGIIPYVKPLVVIGAFFALYQIIIQQIPGFDPISLCGGTVSCQDKVPIGLGPITLPMLSLVNFLILFFLLRK